MMRRGSSLQAVRPWTWFVTLLTLGVCLFSLLPVYWMLVTSLEPNSATLHPKLVPGPFELSNYASLFQQATFRPYLVNSLVVAFGTTVLTVVVTVMAGYALVRFTVPGRTWMARLILFVYMFPAMALAIPLTQIFNWFGLVNTQLGLILAHSSITVPFGVWLMWQYFQTVPTSYQESAYSLGAGRLRTLIEVEVPLARSGVTAVAIFAFALSWEDYTMAFILSRDASAQTLPVILGQFNQRYAVDWGAATAAAVVLGVPALIIVIFLQRFLVRGVGLGGVK